MMTSFNTLLSAGQIPLPTPDPLGYPLPAILIQALSYLTLSLHFLAMNFTLGGLMLLIWAKVRKGPGHLDTSKFLGAGLPLGFSYLVTLGIPPLLFVQVLYGQLFYSSSVIIGVLWILVIPLLITAYAILYSNKFSKKENPRFRPFVLLVALLAMLTVGFAYVNNITLSMTPDSWMGLYASSPSGANLNLSEPTLFPRYMLFMVPALSVAGLSIVLVGSLLGRWREENIGKPVRSFGVRAFLIGRVLTAGAGAWMIASLPGAISEGLFAGGIPTLLLGTGLLLSVLATAFGLLGYRKGSPKVTVFAIVLMFLEIAGFVILRDLVRQDYLAQHFALADVPINTQWGMFAIFGVCLLLGLLLLIVLTYKVGTRAIDAAKERWRAGEDSA